MIGNRLSFMLILAMSKLSSFDDNRRFFDTSSMVRLRSPPNLTPDIYDNAFSSSLTTKALYSSSMKWFDASFRKPTPRGLPSSYIQLQFLSKLNVAHLDEAATRRRRQKTFMYKLPFLPNSGLDTEGVYHDIQRTNPIRQAVQTPPPDPEASRLE
jgi:hypothetical protein